MPNKLSNVYPSIEELLPSVLLTRIPATLARDIEERYNTFGEKYLTEELTVDGRRINACMRNSSIQDAIEEVIDAVFNVLVWIFKCQPFELSTSSYICLSGLIEIYGLLSAELAQENAYTNR